MESTFLSIVIFFYCSYIRKSHQNILPSSFCVPFLLTIVVTEHVLKNVFHSLEETHTLLITVTSKVETKTINSETVLEQHMLSTEPETRLYHHPAARKMLEADDLVAPTATTLGVHNSPGIIGGLLSGVFLSFTLWIAVTCLSSIDSAPMMVNSPPGPKEGDPQFIGTPREGTRYYPYKNQPVKEN